MVLDAQRIPPVEGVIPCGAVAIWTAIFYPSGINFAGIGLHIWMVPAKQIFCGITSTQ
jgi:hypothetical protein